MQSTTLSVSHLVREALPREESSPWTDAKNDRRCFLVDKDIEGNLSPEEGLELDALQQELLSHRQRVAPLPIAAARILHAELLRKAGEGSQ